MMMMMMCTQALLLRCRSVNLPLSLLLRQLLSMQTGPALLL
jgi:hypothetical protein